MNEPVDANTDTTPLILISALNGARRNKSDHPLLPMSVSEIADCARGVCEEGASILHLHVRDEAGRHSLDPDRYRAAIRAIRDQVGDQLVIQVTTEACAVYSPEQQMEVIKDLRPEAVSIALRELIPSPAKEIDAHNLHLWLQANDVFVQYIIYSPEEVQWFSDLCRRGVIGDKSTFVLFVLGQYLSGQNGNPTDIAGYRRNLADDSVAWAVCCFGGQEDEAARIAAISGGHARIGFENNLWMPDGALAPDNAALVRLAATHGRNSGRPIASADDVRRLFV